MARKEKPRVALGRTVRTCRLERDLTQEALAQGAGITVGHLSKIERGLSNATWETVVALANALEVSVSDLADIAARSNAS